MDSISHLVHHYPESFRKNGFFIVEAPQNNVYHGTLELRHAFQYVRVHYLLRDAVHGCQSYELAVFEDPHMQIPIIETVVHPHPFLPDISNVELYIDRRPWNVPWTNKGTMIFRICDTIIMASINRCTDDGKRMWHPSSYCCICFEDKQIADVEDTLRMPLQVIINVLKSANKVP